MDDKHKLHSLDEKMRSKNQNILLTLDRCPAHPLNMQFQNIKLAFFPANCTTELQSLDLVISHSFKLNYRKNIIQKAVTLLDCSKDPREMKISKLHTLHCISKAWKAVQVLMIMNSFMEAGLCLENSEMTLQETH
jgi:hypothetical protein